jgi:DNA-directed RNA polymerase subunit RPC12/RpoP
MMSFILIGLGRRVAKDLGETGQEQRCLWCSNKVFYHLILVRTWLTFFFVPLFAYRNEYRVECPSCSHGIEIRDNEIKAAKRGELRLRTYTTE